MRNNNVIHYNFRNDHANGAVNNSSPPTDGVKVTLTRKHGDFKVVTNLAGLSEHDLLWALINDAAHTLKQRENVMDEKEGLVHEYIAN